MPFPLSFASTSMSFFVRVFLLIFSSALLSFTHAVVTPFLEQSFFFDYTNQSQPFTIPVTKQCETINIKWERSTATGPNPVSPYYLQVYTSAFNIPFVIPAGDGLSFDWQVPFAPGTLYQICMFDKNGNTGGCQATYTMISADSNPQCANITFHPLLNVDAEVDNGPMSQYGWIDQCTDISLTPKNGTPPYTMTVAPALHPPYNITGDDMKSINWTVSLSWASPFFVSLVDSTGSMWSNGLLHSGGGGTTACLSTDQNTQQARTVKPVIAIGSGVGGLVAGLVLGTASACLLVKCRTKRHSNGVLLDFSGSPPGSPQGTTYGHPMANVMSDYRPVPSTGAVIDSSVNRSDMSSNSIINRVQSTYTVEPFMLPGEHGQLPTSPGGSIRPHSTHDLSAGSSQGRQQGQGSVYVVHHDSGRAPVTVYHEDGTQIVELPPRYPDGVAPSRPSNSVADSRSQVGSDGRSDAALSDPSDGPSFLIEPRRPAVARKPGSRDKGLADNTLL